MIFRCHCISRIGLSLFVGMIPKLPSRKLQLMLYDSLTCGSCHLTFGAIADVVGSRTINLIGSVLIGVFVLASGLVETGVQLICMRALQGMGAAMFLPTSISAISNAVAAGRVRNVGFSCTGLAQPLGFLVGLVLGGILVQTVGWRAGYYTSGSVVLSLAAMGWWTIPNDTPAAAPRNMLASIAREIDWVGAGIASASMALLSYVLSMVTTSTEYIHRPYIIALLTMSLVFLMASPLWMRRQTQHARPALIPNALWKNLPFTSVALM